MWCSGNDLENVGIQDGGQFFSSLSIIDEICTSVITYFAGRKDTVKA